MSEEFTEALLELHYHRAIVDAFADVFGARFLRMLKPSTQQEAWVGFDQGWVHASVTTADLYASLSHAISSGGTQNSTFHFGYFLQFKVVHRLPRRSRFTPARFYAPYLRSELSVWRNPTTGLSQHETLCRLASIQHAEVYYACPLLFNLDAIYEYPDLDSLQIVDVASATSDIDDSDRHFIAFQSETAPLPEWCSEPSPAKAYRSSEWIRDERYRPRHRSGKELIEVIEQSKQVLSEVDRQRTLSRELPRSLTTLSFSLEKR